MKLPETEIPVVNPELSTVESTPPTITVTLPETETVTENSEVIAAVAEVKAEQAIEAVDELKTETTEITEEIQEEIEEIESWTTTTEQSIQALTLSQANLTAQLAQATALIESLAQIMTPSTPHQLSREVADDLQNPAGEPLTPEATPEADASIKKEAKAEVQNSRKLQRQWN